MMEGGSPIPADDQRARQTEPRDRMRKNFEETHRELHSLVSKFSHMAAIEVGIVPSAQVLEGLVALYLQTPEENRQVITDPML